MLPVLPAWGGLLTNSHLSFSSALPTPLPQALPVSRSDCECSQWEVWKHAFFLELGAWAGRPLPACPWGSPHCPVQKVATGLEMFSRCSVVTQQAELLSVIPVPSSCPGTSPPVHHPSAPRPQAQGSLAPGPRPHCLLHVQPSLLAPGLGGARQSLRLCLLAPVARCPVGCNDTRGGGEP